MGVLVAVACLAPPAHAQKKSVEKKIYCWDDAGSKVCGDALPAHAVDNARTEFSASGTRVAQIGRALTDEEKAAVAALAAIEQQAARENADQARHERAMVNSYDNEADLRRGFQHRISLVEASARTSELGIESIRASLMSLLRRAAEAELSERPVGKSVADNILAQHHGMRRQQALLRQQQVQLRLLEEEMQAALLRFRELKQTRG